ncbi:MAG: regulator of sirC expression with transglutaminase-like and TPR domain [Lentimonas sp.]|jgi:regulator of sirC expression with transglutaminase-like and TPR domain
MSKHSHLKALIRLVEDPDEIVFSHIRSKLIDCGKEAIPFLEMSWEEEDFGILFQSRIEDIIHDIQFEEVCGLLSKWHASDNKELLEGALILSQFQYPGLERDLIFEEIQEIKQAIWLELSLKNTAMEKVRIFNKVFYGKYGFKGDSKHYHSPLNSYINTVLEMKRGNPLSLSILYSVIAQELKLPIYGVNLPNHFVLAYMDENHSLKAIGEQNSHGVLFYINAFSKGSLFDDSEIKQFLTSINTAHLRGFFEPCSHTQIIKRMINNLINSFKEVGNAQKLEELQILKQILD